MHRAIAVTPVVHVPVPVRVCVPVLVTLALKFSRSPYLDNHSSESIHTWTIDSFHSMASGPWVQARGWGSRLKSRTPSKMAILALKFSRSPYHDNHSSESMDTWAIDTL